MLKEDLRKWFSKTHPEGNWVRMSTKGKILGPCAREPGEGKPKCLPLAKARAMDKEDRATAVQRKRREDPQADRSGKGEKPVMVKTESFRKFVDIIDEANKPTNPDLWARAKALAKSKFDVYPSAYANGYAVQVCKGTKEDFLGEKYPDTTYINKNYKKDKVNPLQRWYNEQWVNVCEKGDGPGGYKLCGTGKGINDPQNYPYCRAYYKLPGTTVTTAQELTQEEIDIMCKAKRSKKQGIDGKPTRVLLSENIPKGGSDYIEIPLDVQKEAKLGLELIKNGFDGGTQTGWDRGKQLAYDKKIDIKSLADMRTWFARHGPDAKNGGTSYPGYCEWVRDGKPTNNSSKNYRGAVSWLIWGGNAAYQWLKTDDIINILEKAYPKRKKSVRNNNLKC